MNTYNIRNNTFLPSNGGAYIHSKLKLPLNTSETINKQTSSEIKTGGELDDFQKKLSNLTIKTSSESIQSSNLPGQRKKNINFVL